MGARHFLMRTLGHVQTEMSLHVFAYNVKRVIRIMGVAALMQAMQAREGLVAYYFYRFRSPFRDART